MKKSYVVLMMAVVMFCSPLVTSVYAGEIVAKEITETEDAGISTVESTPMLTTQCGGNGGDALLAGIGTFFVVLIIMGIVLGAGA